MYDTGVKCKATEYLLRPTPAVRYYCQQYEQKQQQLPVGGNQKPIYRSRFVDVSNGFCSISSLYLLPDREGLHIKRIEYHTVPATSCIILTPTSHSNTIFFLYFFFIITNIFTTLPSTHHANTYNHTEYPPTRSRLHRSLRENNRHLYVT